jgi:hypothetical protein
MNDTQTVLQAARMIRPYLPELLEVSAANEIAQHLDPILRQTSHSEADAQAVLAILESTDITQEWLRLSLEEHRSPDDILKILWTYQPLPGKSGAIASPRYRCPVSSCHQHWYRRHLEDTIPNCPIHGVQMVRDSKVTLT